MCFISIFGGGMTKRDHTTYYKDHGRCMSSSFTLRFCASCFCSSIATNTIHPQMIETCTANTPIFLTRSHSVGLRKATRIPLYIGCLTNHFARSSMSDENVARRPLFSIHAGPFPKEYRSNRGCVRSMDVYGMNRFW